MPPHKAQYDFSPQFYATQTCIKTLLEKGFVALPSNSDTSIINMSDMHKCIFVSHEPYTVEQYNEIPPALATPRMLYDALQNYYQSQSQSYNKNIEWNYLGKPDEKDAYFQYLQDEFWRHQDLFETLQVPITPTFIEKSWQILHYSDKFLQPLKTPDQCMSTTTQQFLSQLITLLPNWDLNPYLVHNNIGTLHWQIPYINDSFITGFIFKESDKLVQHISFGGLFVLDSNR
jgi:hypothetical protein